MQFISFVPQHFGNLFGNLLPTTSWWFLSWCLSQCILSKPVYVYYKHIQAPVCLGCPKAMHHLAFGWPCPFPLPRVGVTTAAPDWPNCALWATITWLCSCCAGRIELQFLSLRHLVGIFHSPCVVFFSFVHLLCCVCPATEGLKLFYYFASFVFHLKQAQWMTLVRS